MASEHLFIPVPGSKLEARLHAPEGGGPFAGVVVCHPHPHYGGSMDNNVVAGLCNGLVRAGVAALSFNYRGIGLSEGSTSADERDVDDAAAVLQYLGSRLEAGPRGVGIAGYSFGARVSLRLASRGDSSVCAVASVAFPARDLSDPEIQAIPVPKLLISGDRDRIVSVEDFQRLSPQFRAPKDVVALDGADHFLLGREEAIGDLAGSFFAQWLSPPAGAPRQAMAGKEGAPTTQDPQTPHLTLRKL